MPMTDTPTLDLAEIKRLADDVERAETRIAEWEGRTNVASEPMTLAEFEREAVKRVRLAQQPDSVMNYERPEDVVGYGLRPLVLRLLAGERERVVAEFSTIADKLKPDGRPLTGADLQMRNALFLGAGVIRCMEDPT